MGKATAPHVIENFEAASKGLNKNKFTQVSSDGPNVNLKFLEFLAEEHKHDGLNEFIYIGACSLRTVNRAFQNAENSNIWNIEKLLCAMHKIFNKSSSRRADYERILSVTKEYYPLFFSSTSWVENANVAKKKLRKFRQSLWQQSVISQHFQKITCQVEVIPSKTKVTRYC